MPSLNFSQDANELIKATLNLCAYKRDEFVTPEHLAIVLMHDSRFLEVYSYMSLSAPEEVIYKLEDSIADLDKVPQSDEQYYDGNGGEISPAEYNPEPSYQFNELITDAYGRAQSSASNEIKTMHLISALLSLEDSDARHILLQDLKQPISVFLAALISSYEPFVKSEKATSAETNREADKPQKSDDSSWRSLVECINDHLDPAKPLVGREPELERTIQILCRREKNNPLHVGHPGVGKTALVYGLAALIEKGDVPERLRNSKIYRLDMGSLLAGTQYRGDMEKRIKTIMDGVSQQQGSIIYIDEIHTLVGAGKISDGSMDASNMLKPYLEEGKVRFIGSTTYDEYKRYFEKHKSLVRRFQQIDIEQPSVEETIEIARQLRPGYEQFHDVKYTDSAIELAVKGSHKHLTDRFLPDKALDIIDESGAYRELHPTAESVQIVDDTLVSEVLAKQCKVESLAIREEAVEQMSSLRERVEARIYGQADAVRSVTEAVEMSKAGLTDDNKPIASLLFVGPTGVGKTELARVLASELGVELIRFDMSEYAEKHAVAKLIGSPAGYVGYEDGGLLVDAIRRTPNCVLLLDEIEKAHGDIYNILLQVMDYARLTDNRGQQADFRNVVLIMTSNAGAQFAKQSVGFANEMSAGHAMMKEVRKTFKPEFLNRLSGTAIFGDMDRKMASMILDKKLKELADKIATRNISLKISDKAKEYLLEKGFTKEYGARELDRVISADLKPLLMREILYGKLKGCGNAIINEKNGKLILKSIKTR